MAGATHLWLPVCRGQDCSPQAEPGWKGPPRASDSVPSSPLQPWSQAALRRRYSTHLPVCTAQEPASVHLHAQSPRFSSPAFPASTTSLQAGAHVSVRVHMYARVCACVCACACMHASIRVCTSARVCMCVRACVSPPRPSRLSVQRHPPGAARPSSHGPQRHLVECRQWAVQTWPDGGRGATPGPSPWACDILGIPEGGTEAGRRAAWVGV